MTLPRSLFLVRDHLDDLVDSVNAQLDAGIGPTCALVPNGSTPNHFAPTRERPCPVMRERGVYVADWQYQGTPIVYSINSRHEVEQWVHWYDGESFETIELALWRHLNAVDPVPRLTVVTD